MAKVVETVQRIRKVEEATSLREEPAPVFLLDEILEIARSSAESAHGIADHIVKRLAHKSPVVKFKALRLVKHMCSKGAPQFQRSLQRQPQAIRDLVHYKGDPDPFKGDAPNLHVRELAKETIEVLFNATAAPAASAAPQMQGRIQGFGSSMAPGSAAGAPSMPSFSPGSKMVGFGNTRTEQPLPPLGTPQSVSNMLGSMGAMLKSATSSIGGPPSQHHARMFDSPPREPPLPGSGHWAPTAAPYAAPAVTAAQVMGSEEALVGDLCAPGGMRAAPQQEDLDRFVAAVGSMDGLRVGELLREKMESSSWQTVLRALCALNAVVDKGSSQGCGEVAVMFQSDPTPLHQALQSPHAPVREAAARTMKLLLNEDVVVAAAAPKKYVAKSYLSSSRQQQQQQQQQAAAAAQPDLLGLSSSPSPRRAAPSPDLLGGFSSSPERAPPAAAPIYTPPTPPQPQDTLFSGLQTAAPTTSTSDQMFGGLHISESPVSTLPAQQPQPQQQQQDLLDLSDPTPSAAAPSAALDLLFAGSPSPTTHPPQYSSLAHPLAAHPTPNLLCSSPDLLGGSASSSTSDLLGMQLPSPAPLAPLGMQPPQQMPGYAAPLGGYGPQQPGLTQPAWTGAGLPTMSASAPSFPAAAYAQPQLPTGYMPDAGQYGGQYGGMGGVPGGQQQAMHAAAAAAALQNQMSGGIAGSRGAGLGGGPMRQASWGGKDEVSNLMRHVASGGKHDPAFDFIKDELKPHK